MNGEFSADLRVFKEPINGIEFIRNLTQTLSNEHDPFYVVDLEDICKKHIKWITALPRVSPHYAVKCNNDPILLKLLAFLGAGFDCASRNEIKSILDLGVSSDRIIYANPCKQASMIKYANKNGVDLMTFDNESELHKIKEHHPNARLVLRIITNDADAVCRFSMKFGADMNTSRKLIDTAARLNLDLVGISFHVGSGQMSPAVFSESINNARILFDYAASQHNIKLTLLDIGGGFPGSDESSELFDSIANEINKSLDLHFPLNENNDDNNDESMINVKIIAEPGRYYACSAFTLCANVIAKRIMEEECDNNNKSIMYYINDGVYASFNCILYDHIHEFKPILLKDGIEYDKTFYKSSIWGPTCDGLDCVMKECKLPEMDTGDFIAFKNMGAYTISGACPFNGIPLPKPIYIASTSWNAIKDAFAAEIDEILIEEQQQQQQHLQQTCCAATRRSKSSNKRICTAVDSTNVTDENCAITC